MDAPWHPISQPLGELEPGIGLCLRPGVAQVHLVGIAGVVVRVVEGADEIGKGFIDDGLRGPSLQDAAMRVLEKQLRSCASRL